MRHSRYIWILAISLSCLLGLMAWKTPESVLSALAHPEYADSPHAAIQHFWNLLDSRQFDLAREMTGGSQLQELPEFTALSQTLAQNPLLSLQKVEFVDGGDPAAITVKVTWVVPPREVKDFTYRFSLVQRGDSWRIAQFSRLS